MRDLAPLLASHTKEELAEMVLDYGQKFKNILDLVHEQAEDEALWCDALYIMEAYVQNALRQLHRVIEDPLR